MDQPDSLTELQIDTIREISNIGMGNAATALSQMVGGAVSITVPEAHIIDVTEVPLMMGGEEITVAASYTQVMGQVRGHLVIAFAIDDMHRLINILAPDAELNVMEDEMARSAVQEIGNILGSSFLQNFAEMTKLTMLPTVPAVAVDFAGSILTYVVSSMAEITERLVVVQTEFDIGGEKIRGLCMFIPEPGALKVILDSLGVGD